ncbi:MAG: hypothetical protein LM580_08155 [Thermofilum sp.]|nr:hypothetical protein [Thermofilum sp.]
MESLGTWAAEADAERFLRECVDWVEDRLRRQALSYFFGEGLGEAYTLVGYMRLLLEKHKGAPPLGLGALARLLTELCKRRGAKRLFPWGSSRNPRPQPPRRRKPSAC